MPSTKGGNRCTKSRGESDADLDTTTAARHHGGGERPEGLLLIGLGVGGFMGYRRVTTLVTELQERQIAPLTAKVHAILEDLQGVTGRMQAQAARVDNAIHGTLAKVDSTAAGVKDAVRYTVDSVVGVARGVRAVLASLFGRKVTEARI